MTDGHSVTVLMEDLKRSDPAAMRAIWDRFYPELLRIARSKLQGMKLAAADEEDVVLSVMNNLFAGAQQGRFPNLADPVWCHHKWDPSRPKVSSLRRCLSELATHDTRL